MATIEDKASTRAPFLPPDFSAVNTILSADRTLMSWIRTSLSMLSFGFTIYKFLDAMAQHGQIDRTESPRRVGLALCAMGVAAMLLGTMGYWMTLREIRHAGDFRMARPVLIMALIMCFAGLTLFAGILKRLV